VFILSLRVLRLLLVVQGLLTASLLVAVVAVAATAEAVEPVGWYHCKIYFFHLDLKQ
jgi:hypothetical protein